jgi:hypothetical protein
MSDVAATEVLEPIPPGAEAIAELDAAPGQADVPAAEESASGEAETEAVESFDPRISIPESLGPVRRGILEGLIDGEGALSVAELHALMPVGTPRGTTEAGILREYRSGRIIRTSPGHYALAPARPPEAKRPSSPPPPTPDEEAMWFSAFDAWISEPETWDRTTLGPRPNEPGRRIPPDIVAKGVDRSRKREARRRDADEAAADRAAADRELRDKLLAAANGNFQPGPALDDMTCVREVLKTVALDQLIMTIRQRVDRRCFPGNAPLTSWKDESFLRAVAEDFCRSFAVPGLVREWSNAGRTQAKAPISLPAGLMPDDADELRSRHDVEHAPPGPHSLAADAAVDMSQELASASEAPAATQGSPGA